MDDQERTERIRCLNDELRCHGRGGRVLISRGIANLGPRLTRRILREVAAFHRFTFENDPYEEHDCASLDVDEDEILWKIDYYDRTYSVRSPEPADPEVTNRVLTLMLVGEY